MVLLRIADGLRISNILTNTEAFVYLRRFLITILFCKVSILQTNGSSTWQEEDGVNHEL